MGGTGRTFAYAETKWTPVWMHFTKPWLPTRLRPSFQEALASSLMAISHYEEAVPVLQEFVKALPE